MRTRARFPEVDRREGHYESFYVKACRPGGGLGVWLRHTVHKRPDHDPTASLWLTVFDADAPGPVATKLTLPRSELAAPADAYIRVGEAVLAPGGARGSLATDALAASWDLTFSDRHEVLHHLPRGWMYGARLPRTKLLSPHPGARFSGRLVAGEREIELDDWPGMIGHNWGAEHAERWIWIHGAGFDGDSGSGYVDIAAGRIKVGGLTIPWVANGALAIDGELHRLGGLGRIRSTTIDEGPTSCELSLAGAAIELRGTVRGEPKDFVGWVYADPDGSEHNTLNCSIADLELELRRGDGEPERLGVTGAAAYEIGMREGDHGIPIQPYADG